MSSTNKTQNLQLNSWLGSDVPQMEDFNRDNVIIDSAISSHGSNVDIHLTASERQKWNNPYFMFTYYGNGSASRSITVESSFVPKWGIIFAVNKTADVTDFNNKADYNYLAFVSSSGSMQGASLSAKQLTVTQPPSAALGNEYKAFNEVGVTYVCIMFA